MKDPLHHLKTLSAPQRPGFRAQLEQQVQAAIASTEPQPSMKHTLKKTFFKFLLATPLVAGAAYGIVFALNQAHMTPSAWTATQVQAAMVKSIAETFSDVQAGQIQYQKFTRQDSGTPYTDENWRSGVNSIDILTDNTSHQVANANLNQLSSAHQGTACAYDPNHVLFEGPQGSSDAGLFNCMPANAIQTAFVQATGTDIKPTTHIFTTADANQWLTVQWLTHEPIAADTITTEVLAVTDGKIMPYRYTQQLTQTDSTDVNNFVNQATADGSLHSVVIPDLAYLAKYEADVTPQVIYFQMSYDTTLSAVYSYNVVSKQLSIADTDQVAAVTTDYETKQLEDQATSHFNIANDSKEALDLVKTSGNLQTYAFDPITAELHTTYTLSDGTYQFFIDTKTNQIKRWSVTTSDGDTTTITIQANTTLSDDPITFFTEAHWKQLLSDRGVTTK